MFQPNETEGKKPYLFSGPKTDEPSALAATDNKYLFLYE